MQAQGKTGTNHFWVVAVPKKDVKLDALKGKTSGLLNGAVSELDYPRNFRHGTMDELYGLSDDLVKMDSFVETVVAKTAKQLKDLSVESGRDDGKMSLTVGTQTVTNYLRGFEWNSAKYRTISTLRDIAETITQEVTQSDEELRDYQSKYSTINHAIEVAERNKSGSLQVRDLSNVIGDQHIIESEHLATLFVVVSKNLAQDWENSYEQLADNVVPRSSDIITKDDDNSLRSVVLFKNSVEPFKQAASKKKFVVRDFTYNPDETDDKKEKLSEHIGQKQEMSADLTRWCKTSFGDTFQGWVHLKIVRLFVESVLRFGLPRDYVFMILEPNMKKEKSIRDALQSVYASLGSEHLQGDTGDVSVAGLQEEFFPYVFTSLDF